MHINFNFFFNNAFLISQEAFENYTFLPFSVLLACFWVFTYYKVPETKNKTFEEISAIFQRGVDRYAVFCCSYIYLCRFYYYDWWFGGIHVKCIILTVSKGDSLHHTSLIFGSVASCAGSYVLFSIYLKIFRVLKLSLVFMTKHLAAKRSNTLSELISKK